jgi:hypothetical protein
MQLQDYITDTQALLHDQYGLFTPTYQLTRWINQARDQVAQDTGCLRVIVTGDSPFGAQAQAGVAVPGGAVSGNAPVSEFFTVAGQEMYPFGYANQTAVAQNRGMRAIIDVNNVAVSWGGALRPVQNWMPWDQLQAYARSYNVGVFSYPFCWATSGVGVNNRVWLWPAPSVVTEMEWDCTMLPAPLYSNDDYEAIPDPYGLAVKFFAANLAFMASFRNAQAQDMKQQYMQQIASAAGSADRGHVPDYYTDATSW